MTDRYDDEEGGPGDDRLDELLCEYVDGSMDDAVRAAFEEYLLQNPDLAQLARRLIQTRLLLCSQRRCAHAPHDLQHRLQIEIARDLMGVHPGPEVVGGLGRFATLSSALGMAVLLGALVGTSLVERSSPTGAGAHPLDWSEDQTAPSDAHGFTTRLSRRGIRAAGFGVLGPAVAMPEVAWSAAMTPIPDSDSLSASALRRTSAVP